MMLDYKSLFLSLPLTLYANALCNGGCCFLSDLDWQNLFNVQVAKPALQQRSNLLYSAIHTTLLITAYGIQIQIRTHTLTHS